MPSRRRAKTAEEREQIQAERRKKNIRAAYNSRERKRILLEKLGQENEEFRIKMGQVQQANELLVFQLSQMRQKLKNVEEELRSYRANIYTNFTADGGFEENTPQVLFDSYIGPCSGQTAVMVEELDEPCVRSVTHL